MITITAFIVTYLIIRSGKKATMNGEGLVLLLVTDLLIVYMITQAFKG